DVPHSPVIAAVAEAGRQAARGLVPAGTQECDERERNVGRLITAYRSRGHLGAKLDPLALAPPMNPPDLGLDFHNLSERDLDSKLPPLGLAQPTQPPAPGLDFDILPERDLASASSPGGVAGRPRMKLRDLLARLKATYTGPIGAEFMHIPEVQQRQWLYQRLEAAGGDYNLSAETRKRVLERLTAAEGLERYLHTKYVGQKRFSLEGGDSLIPLLDTVIRQAGMEKVKDIVIGMAHRGRLNVLVNTLGKNPRVLFDEFEGKFEL